MVYIAGSNPAGVMVQAHKRHESGLTKNFVDRLLKHLSILLSV